MEDIFVNNINQALGKTMTMMNDMLNLFMAERQDMNKLEKFKNLFFSNLEYFPHSEIVNMEFMNLVMLLTIYSNNFTQKRNFFLI